MNTSSIEIRLAKSEDAAAIAVLLVEAFAEYRSLYTSDGYAATAITREEVLVRIGEGPVWVALSGELILGTVSVVLRDKSLYVRGMAVLPAVRGQRIGELLLTHVQEFGVSNECGDCFSAPRRSWIGQSGYTNILVSTERARAQMICSVRLCLR